MLVSEVLAEEEGRRAESFHPDVVPACAWVWPEREACVFQWLSLEVNVNEMLTQMKKSEAPVHYEVGNSGRWLFWWNRT